MRIVTHNICVNLPSYNYRHQVDRVIDKTFLQSLEARYSVVEPLGENIHNLVIKQT